MKVTRQIIATRRTMLRAQLYYLAKKSLWMYLFAMLIIGYYMPLPGQSWWLSAALYFVCLMVIVVAPLYYLSAGTKVKSGAFNFNIEFSEENIQVFYPKSNKAETKSWDWVQTIDIINNGARITVRMPNRLVIFLDRLNKEELAFFKKMKDALHK